MVDAESCTNNSTVNLGSQSEKRTITDMQKHLNNEKASRPLKIC